MNRNIKTVTAALAVAMAAVTASPAMAATPASTARPWLVTVAGIPGGPGNTPRPGGSITLTNTGENPAPTTVTVWKISQPFDWNTPREAMKAQERFTRETVMVAGSPAIVAVKAPPCGPWQWDVKVERSPKDFVWVAGGTSRGVPCATPAPTPAPTPTLTAKPTVAPTAAPVPSGTKAPVAKPASIKAPVVAPVGVAGRVLPAAPVSAQPTLADTGPWNAGVMALIGGLLLLFGLALIGAGNRAGHRTHRR